MSKVTTQALKFAGASPEVVAYLSGREASDASGNPSTAYVTSQLTTPTTTFITPIVVNTTPSTGGTYAWDGAAYVQIGLPLS